jgi:uncharacterized membrane protein
MSGVLAAIKMALGSWIVFRLHQRGIVSDRVLLIGAAAWLLAVMSLYGVIAWFFDTRLLPHDFFWSVAILCVPLARLSAAPLALTWNRHR